MSRLAPSFLIIGAQKAGTSALYYYLCQHPHIIRPQRKEIDFFWQSSRYARGTDWYLSHFAEDDGRPDVVTFEATPHYLHTQEAAARIHAFNPKMKLIVLLREPVARAWSQYRMYMTKHGIPGRLAASAEHYDGVTGEFMRRLSASEVLPGFETLITEEIECLRRGDIHPGQFVRQGLYAQHLQTYFALFPKSQILILPSRKMRNARSYTLGTVTDFLGLPAPGWFKIKTPDIYVGTDEGKVPEGAARKLRRFFEPHNEMLQQMLRKRFW